MVHMCFRWHNHALSACNITQNRTGSVRHRHTALFTLPLFLQKLVHLNVLFEINSAC